MTIYASKAGETLDLIVFKFYGKTEGFFEACLRENRHLNHLPAILPSGIEICLPNLKHELQEASNSEVTLWD